MSKDQPPGEKAITPDYSDTTRYRILDGGAVYGLAEGRIVAHLHKGGGPYQITRETARGMLERRRQLGVMAQLRGLARAFEIDLSEADMERIAEGAGSALEAITEHMARTFMQSKNLRGMAEAYNKLTAPMLGEAPKFEAEYAASQVAEAGEKLLELLQQASPQAVEGKVIE